MYKILKKTIMSETTCEYVIHAPHVAKRCEPGQFVILIPVKGSERIPMTITDYNREEGTVNIVFQIVGRSTQELSLLQVGDYLEAFVGPLGIASELKPGKRVLGVAGGVGIAPLYPQIKKLKELGSKVDVVLGARNESLLMLTRRTREIAENFYIATDDGSVGHKGFVTDIVKALIEKGEHYDEVIAIGPVVMMRAVANLTKQYNLPTMVSLNPIMIDGTGMCGCCRVKVGGVTKFACVDGPDFDGLQVDFDELMKRQQFFKDIEAKSKLEPEKIEERKEHCECLSAAVESAKENGVEVEPAAHEQAAQQTAVGEGASHGQAAGKATEKATDKVTDRATDEAFANAQASAAKEVHEFDEEATIVDKLAYETGELGLVKEIITLECNTKGECMIMMEALNLGGQVPQEEKQEAKPAPAARRKPNMKPEKTPMPEQPPLERIQNFKEVALGYTLEDAVEEATRCLQCKHKPCVDGCPVNVPIPEFIEAVVNRDIKEAYRIILTQNRLPAICGRVCPQESQCEQLCVRAKRHEAVSIGRLERFVADYYMAHYPDEVLDIKKNGKKVAVVGAGPAGLTCCSELASKGYDVTLFEALHELGGVLSYGIPEFRLPKSLVKAEIDKVLRLGVKVHKNVVIGQSLLFEDLFEQGFDAIFVGSGAGLPNFMGIPGEDLNGVYSANEFLTRVNLMKAYEKNELTTPIKTGKNVAVVGGGNVAMDAARTAKRLGAENVYIVYRRGESELPARLEEIHHAKEEQIDFRLLNNPVEILGEDGNVKAMRCIKMELGEPDASGRRSPKPIPGSEFELEVDSVVIAIGQNPNPIIKRAQKQLETNKWGCIVVNEDDMKTSMDRVYAGGDVVTGAATVILAMGAAKKAAMSIDKLLMGEK